MLVNRRLTQARQDARSLWSKSSVFDKVLFAVAVVYVAAVTAFFLLHHTLISPDQFFLIALLISLLVGRIKAFLWDWVPLIALLFGYEYVRGLVPLVNQNVYIRPMIDVDRFLFGGQIPTISMQAKLYTPGVAHWYDYAAVCFYLMHFVLPLAVGFLFWLRDRKVFREYAAGMLLTSYLAYLTYLVFPAAPPWMAADAGFLPNIYRIFHLTLAHFSGDPVFLPTLYYRLGANNVAAVPSLHAAFPLLVALFVGERTPKLLPLAAIYVLGVWWAIVYLGEHYVFDAITGALYAIAGYLLVVYWPSIKKKLFRSNKSPGAI